MNSTKMECFMAKANQSALMSNSVVLLARILLIWLFVIYGWSKLTDFGATETYMSHVGAPLPFLAAVIAVIMEFFAGVAIFVGLFTRPIALLLALYTLGTALIGHHYWTMTGAEQYVAKINFYKNISIVGGFLLLYVTGAGKYSADGFFDKTN